MDITVDAFSNVSEAGGGQPSLKRYDSLKAQQDTILSVIDLPVGSLWGMPGIVEGVGMTRLGPC